MKRETLRFGECVIEVTIIDNIIYLKTFGMYTDHAAIDKKHRCVATENKGQASAFLDGLDKNQWARRMKHESGMRFYLA